MLRMPAFGLLTTTKVAPPLPPKAKEKFSRQNPALCSHQQPALCGGNIWKCHPTTSGSCPVTLYVAHVAALHNLLNIARVDALYTRRRVNEGLVEVLLHLPPALTGLD